MAGTVGRIARDLIEEIEQDGPAFGWFQAVRLLALAQGPGHGAVPRTLRFRTPASLSFPASEIAGVQTEPAADHSEASDKASQARQMTVSFLGLTGPSGVLPAVYTELLVERRNLYRDDTAHRFFDLFSHRAISLFYQAWRKHRFYIGYEAGQRDGFTQHLLDTVGAGLPSVRQRLRDEGGVPEPLLAHFAGLLSRKPVSASAIAAVLRGCLGVETSVEQFAGQWLAIPVPEQSRLGSTASALGQDACVGERVWDRQMKIRLRLGPLDGERFEDFLPGRPGSRQLRQLLGLCTGTELQVDAVLVLRKDDVPLPVLGDAGGLRLGYDTWLHSGTEASDRDDARFAVIA